MEYPDLSPYEFLQHPLPMLNVGRLGERTGLPVTGTPAPGELELLRAASQRVVTLTLGRHACEFCPADDHATGNGEYRYYVPGVRAADFPEFVRIGIAEAAGGGQRRGRRGERVRR